MTNTVIIQRQQLSPLGAYVEPRSQTERALEEIWRRAFGMDSALIAIPLAPRRDPRSDR